MLSTPLFEIRIRPGPDDIRDAEPFGIPEHTASPDSEDTPLLLTHTFQQRNIGGAIHSRRATYRRPAARRTVTPQRISFRFNDHARMSRRKPSSDRRDFGA